MFLTSNNQRLRSARYNDRRSKRFCSSAVLLCKFHVTDGQNTRDQITSHRRSKCARSKCILCIPYILSGIPKECWLHTCDECVIKTWKLGLWAPLVARNYYFFHFQCWNWLWNGVPQSSISPTTVVDLVLWRRHNPPQIILFLKVTIKRTLQKYNLTLTKMTPTKLLTHCPG